MKKSHRKDVIIARIVFVIFCLILVAVIAGAVLLIKNHFKSDETTTQQTESSATESEKVNTFPIIDDTQDVVLPTVEDSQETESEVDTSVMVKTTTGVNLRSEPSTNSSVVTVLVQGTELKMIGEEDGWAMVEYQGQTGYVKQDYLVEVM